MNIDKTRQTVDNIIEMWNKKDYKSRQYARGKLKMSQWFMKNKTYNFLAEKMDMPLLAEIPNETTITEQVENQDMLKEAQKIFGGKIIK